MQAELSKKNVILTGFKTACDITYNFSKKVKYDHVSSFAGHAALFMLMSIFPMVMFGFSMFKYLPVNAGTLTSYVMTVLPEGLKPLLQQIIEEAYTESTTMVKSFTMLVMLFCASRGIYAMIIGLNAVYGIKETRSFVLLYALAVIYVVAFFAVIMLMMVLIVLGNKIFNTFIKFIPGLMLFSNLFKYGKYLCMLVLLMLFFLIVYKNVPNRKSKMVYELPGSIFSTVIWLAFSWAFSFYINNFAHYSVTYGSLATIVVFILWLYGTMNIVFIGAEINVVLRKFAEYGYNYEMVYQYYKDKYNSGLLGER